MRTKSRKADDAKYRKVHRADKAASDAVYRQSHRAERAAYNMAYRQTHKAERAAYIAAYDKAHPDKYRDRNARRRALKRGSVAERIYRAVVFERDQGRCHLCGRKVNPKKWHLDHIVPLSRGGEHSYKNVAVSHPLCNWCKNNKIRGQFRLF